MFHLLVDIGATLLYNRCMKQKAFTGSRSQWEQAVKKVHPNCTIAAVGGGRFFALVGGVDVGMFSTIQGGGWIK